MMFAVVNLCHHGGGMFNFLSAIIDHQMRPAQHLMTKPPWPNRLHSFNQRIGVVRTILLEVWETLLVQTSALPPWCSDVSKHRRSFKGAFQKYNKCRSPVLSRCASCRGERLCSVDDCVHPRLRVTRSPVRLMATREAKVISLQVVGLNGVGIASLLDCISKHVCHGSETTYSGEVCVSVIWWQTHRALVRLSIFLLCVFLRIRVLTCLHSW